MLLFSVWICYQTVLGDVLRLFSCLPPFALLQSGRSRSGAPRPAASLLHRCHLLGDSPGMGGKMGHLSFNTASGDTPQQPKRLRV